MASSSTAKIERELSEKISLLTPAKKRELLDFATFLTNRRQVKKTSKASSLADFSGIIGIAASVAGETDISVNHDKYACPLDVFIDIAAECKDTDLSINHDKYLYGDDLL